MGGVQDPLEGYTGLSLFSRSFASLPHSSHAQVSGDPHSIHNFLMSMPVQNPDKLVEQAKTILENTTEVPNARMISEATLEKKNEVLGDMAVEYPRGQRPGLQRKRARFSLFPIVSQPTVNFEPTLDYSKSPEEFFSQFERIQNAKKEIARYNGVTYTASDQYNVFKVPQSQRPGIPGRSRKAKYKHLYSDLPSRKTSEGDIPSSCGLQQEEEQLDFASQQTEPESVDSQQFESTNNASQLTESATFATEEVEMICSVAKAKKPVDQFIDEVLAGGYGDVEEEEDIKRFYGDVEEDEDIKRLEEYFQIKPFHMEKLNLPDMQDVPKLDFKSYRVDPPKSRNILSDIHNLKERTRNRTPAKLKSLEISVPNFGSPTPPKNPLASLSLLNKHIFQSNPSRDPFSAIGIDQSPARNSSHVDYINKCSDPVGSEKALCIPEKSTDKEDDVPDDGRSSTEVGIKGSSSSSLEHGNENLTSLGSGSGINTKEAGSELEGNNVGICNEFINENLSQADAHVDHHKNGLDDLEDIVEDVMQDAEASTEPNQNTDYSPMETSNNNQNELDPATVEDQPVYESAQSVNSASLQIQDASLEKTQATSSKLQSEVEDVMQDAEASTGPNQNTDYSPMETSNSNQNELDPATVEDQPVDESAQRVNNASLQIQDVPLEQTQATSSTQTEKMDETSVQSPDELTRKESHPRKEGKRKNLSRRQSLAGCGLSWKAGVRRSTRIRSRPLEYWRGEKFLYGRIHESLATVIGIKYESPGKEKGGGMKVKSFVSEKHKHLVDEAAL